jgi:hypothetical protein
MTIRRQVLGPTVVALVLGLGAVACGGSTAKATKSTFNAQTGRPLTCMAHQTAAPTPLDRPGAHEDPASVLAVLRYYTANGNKPYCDHRPASSIDRTWIALYLAGGAQKSHVRQALSAR